MNSRRGDLVLNESSRAPRKISNCFKDREEELSFFRDLQKHEKDQHASLLHSVSEDFEDNGNYGVYRMGSGGRKGGTGLETGKNDYNWLKTPPATPLFPSLEMETNAQEQLVLQREIPILQPLSRFAGNPESKKTSTNRSTSPNSKPKLSHRPKTPSKRPSISSLIDKKNMKSPPVTNQKMNHKTAINLPDKTKPSFSTPIVKSNTNVRKESHPNFPSSNLSKSMGSIMESNSSTKSRTRAGVSPFMRQTIHAGYSDETPSNLRTTNRPASASRGRPIHENLTLQQKQEINAKIRRQSCSPSVTTRGRKMDNNGNVATQSKVQQTGNRAQVLGSRMVDKFMNARNSSAELDKQAKIKLSNNYTMNDQSLRNPRSEERQGKIKLNGSTNESCGFGRLSKSSLDMALKHMELEREPSSNIRKHGMVSAGRKS